MMQAKAVKHYLQIRFHDYKTQLHAAIENLPEKVTVDQVIDQLIFIEKVERGWKDSENNEVHSHAEAKKMLGKWFTK